jgi:pimeloyl-ACP methyl ester carboxylesterase
VQLLNDADWIISPSEFVEALGASAIADKPSSVKSTEGNLNERRLTMRSHLDCEVIDQDRRWLLSAVAIGITAAGAGSFFPKQPVLAGTADAIRPFRINVPKEALADLRKRINATKWPEPETIADQSQGVQLATMRKLARYWATGYDWRKLEAKLNALPQFITEIDGLDIHFIHVRSMHENALPLVVTHGWPGSIIEQLKIIDPLTNPTAHGGSASDAFHVVIPSMPGYGFSGKPTATGWNTDRIARTWDTLMKRLGYTHYVSQGGDWGAKVSEALARLKPEGLLGIHMNLLLNIPPEVVRAIAVGDPAPAGLSENEKAAFDQRKKLALGYLIEQTSRPQTIGYSLTDSPTGLAAWLLDHDPHSYEQIANVFDGHPEGSLTRDEILDNITLYWLTNSGASAARLYWENARLAYKGQVSIPTAFSVFPGELWRAPRSWVENTYPNLIYFNEVDKGGHFAAWEQPELFSAEVRAAFRSLRKSA